MKNNYTEDLETVRRLLIRHDPYGLMEHGAPTDEYDFEAQQILALVPKCADVRALQQGIYEIFTASFGEETAGTADAYLTLAQDVLNTFHARRKGG